MHHVIDMEVNMYIDKNIFIISTLFQCVVLSVAGVANQSETKSHISYCVTTKSHLIHMGAP